VAWGGGGAPWGAATRRELGVGCPSCSATACSLFVRKITWGRKEREERKKKRVKRIGKKYKNVKPGNFRGEK
jgi:hypothetical protein